jgi:hypothetical protein
MVEIGFIRRDVMLRVASTLKVSHIQFQMSKHCIRIDETDVELVDYIISQSWEYKRQRRV